MAGRFRCSEDDLESHRLFAVSVDLDRVFADAMQLSREHTARLLTRSPNVLHVAAARVVGCSTFVFADDRQLALAEASGLTVVDIKTPSSKEARLISMPR